MPHPKTSLFTEQISRKPDHYPWTEKFMRVMWEGLWTDREFSFATDVQDYKVNMTAEEQKVVANALSAISQIEIAVKTFWAKLGDNLPHPSIRDMGYVMANVEVIHNSAYERLIEELDLEHIFQDNLKLPCVEGRVKYLRKYTHRYYTDSKQQFVYALILFTLFVENVSLFSQFYIINSFGRRGLLKATNQQTKYTAKEEDIHGKIGIKLVNTLREEHPELFDQGLEDKILHEAHEAYTAEASIIDWMLGEYSHDDLDANIAKQFIKDRINTSLVEIGYSAIFETDQDALDKTEWFNEMLEANNMTDFFDTRPVEYAKGGQSFEDDGDLF
tara:strand:- start:8482 stop:9471 length:990 start_codon:yes stop_codon:yes gene_type:complete